VAKKKNSPIDLEKGVNGEEGRTQTSGRKRACKHTKGGGVDRRFHRQGGKKRDSKNKRNLYPRKKEEKSASSRPYRTKKRETKVVARTVGE